MLTFNPVTKQQIDTLVAHLPQGVVLIGAPGMGLLTTAKYVAGTHIAAVIEPTNNDGSVDHAKGTITVNRIRELYNQARSKSHTNQIFIIDDADRMSQSAQNALLKLLEEPNPSVTFILTTHRVSALLPTVMSRVARQPILPITHEQSEQLLHHSKMAPDKTAQALFVAAGKPAELMRMATSAAYFDERATTMHAAKTFLTGTIADRLRVAFTYAAERDKALQLLSASIAILRFSLAGAPNPTSIAHAERLATAYDSIAANGNAKLHLVWAML